jgi:VIT1/CCC1 family predicted Fe2+/Mn2+ transporter
MSAQPQPAPANAAARKRWPRWARRGLMENVAVALIALGVFMLVQPFSIALYGWSFTVVLVGTLMFTIVSKFPE